MNFSAEKIREWQEKLQANGSVDKVQDLYGQMSMTHQFCERFLEFLQQISAIFPECKASHIAAQRYEMVFQYAKSNAAAAAAATAAVGEENNSNENNADEKKKTHVDYLKWSANKWYNAAKGAFLPMIRYNLTIETENMFAAISASRKSGSERPIQELEAEWQSLTSGRGDLDQRTRDQKEGLVRLWLINPEYLLGQINILEKWKDPHVDDTTRTYIICYILQMNGFALLHHLMEHELQLKDRFQKIMERDEAITKEDGELDIQNLERLVVHEVCIPLLDHAIPFWVVAVSLCGANLPGGEYLQSLIYREMTKLGNGAQVGAIKMGIKNATAYFLSLKYERIVEFVEQLREYLQQNSLVTQLNPEIREAFPELLDFLVDLSTQSGPVDMQALMSNPILSKMMTLLQQSNLGGGCKF